MSEKFEVSEKFVEVAAKIGNQIYLRSLRDSFVIQMPVFILSGIAVLLNNAIFPYVFSGQMLENAQVFGNTIINGTVNISAILIVVTIAFNLSKNRNFDNPLAASVVSLAAQFILLPLIFETTPVGSEEIVSITNAISYPSIGTQGMFAGILIGIIATEIFIKLSSFKKLKITLGDGIPPAVGQAFSVMFPSCITLIIMALVATILKAGFDQNLISLITAMIQEPLRKVNTSLPGYLLITTIGNFLFGLGIHQSVVSGSILDPLLNINMNENMLAAVAGQEPPHVLTGAFNAMFPMMGGTGATISLLIAIFVFSKYKPSRDLAKLSVLPSVFEINEPIIFGYPIVYNFPMMIPFLIVPIINTIIGYFATSLGIIGKQIVAIPWITPPIISGYLATAGDWKASVLQALLLVMGAFIYLPFMKISERIAMSQANL